MHPWQWTSQVWHRVHIDYAGPMRGQYFLVITDSTSKWTEIYKTTSITTDITIDLLRNCFARFGIPVVLVSDNGSNFTSEAFDNYMLSLGIRHIKSTVHSPNLNGQAERMVQTSKNGVNHFEGVMNIQRKLDQFLMHYRVTPHSTTGVSPAEMMFGRKIRTKFDLLRPGETIADKVVTAQQKMRNSYNKSAPRKLELRTNDKVKVRNYGRGPKWKDAIITEKTGSVTYRCKVFPDDVIIHRHLNQIWPDRRSSTSSDHSSHSQDDFHSDGTHEDTTEDSSTSSGNSPNIHPTVTRSGRITKPPDRMNL